MSKVEWPTPELPPKSYRRFVEKFPQLAEYREGIGKAVDDLGPLDAKSRELIHMGIAIGAGLVTTKQIRARRAKEAGASHEEVEQAILLARKTCGIPRTVAAWQ